MTVIGKTNQLARNQVSCTSGNSRSSMKERKKKKCVLLEDEMSEDWLQIWTAASLLEVKGNKAIKRIFSLANWSVFAYTVTYFYIQWILIILNSCINRHTN